jgi:hypothetical protein
VSDEHGHGPQVGPVMMFSPLTKAVAQFYAEVIGLGGETGGDEIWLDAANAKVVVNNPNDRQTPDEIRRQSGFVVWFGVADVRAAFDRARRAGALASEFFGDFFFARDPDGRYVGVYTLEEGHGHDHDH